MSRFQNAFNGFFDTIRFDKIENSTNDEISILFSKNGKTIRIDDLSTGEKQIVYRGAYLLRNSGNMEGGIIFVDEPELSMHPTWQRKILSYFTGLFTTSGTQKTQMFFASHSDSVVVNALENDTNNLVIVLTEEGGIVKSRNITAPYALPTITNAEINFLAFNIFSTDYHIALYSYLQVLTGKTTVSSCDTFIHNSALFDATKHTKVTVNGSTTYQTLPTAIRNHIDHPDNPYIYSEEDIKISTLFLIDLIRDWKATHP